MRELLLSNSAKRAILDEEDFIRACRWSWRVNAQQTGIIARVKGTMVTMGSFVLSTREEVDHRDRDIFNNMRSNLRECTKPQNVANRGLQSNNTSGYKGVHFNKQHGKWQAKLTRTVDGIQHTKHLGFFSIPELAALAYNRAAKQIHGDFASLNEVKLP